MPSTCLLVVAGCQQCAQPVARVEHPQGPVDGIDDQHMNQSALMHHREHFRQHIVRFADRDLTRHHIACTGGEEVGLTQP
jgi:hypothetical protein